MVNPRKIDNTKSSFVRKFSYFLFSFLFLILFSFFILSLTSCAKSNNSPRAKDGVIDLRGIDFSNGKTYVRLNGEWELYRDKFILPDSSFLSERKTREIVKVPHLWERTLLKSGRGIPSQGYGTYRLVILVDPEQQDLALRIRGIRSSATLFCNGELVFQSGVPGKTRESSSQGNKIKVVRLIPENGQLEIVIYVSNFFHKFGGLINPPDLGSLEKAAWLEDVDSYREIFLAGCIFCLAVFHIGYFYINRKKKARLYLGLFCLGVSFWSLISGAVYISRIIPIVSWATILHMRTITMSLLVAFFPLYVSCVFPKQFPRQMKYIIIIVALIHILYGFFFASFSSGYALPFFWIIMLFVVIFLIYIYWAAMRAREVDSILFFIGGVTFLGFAVNDILHGYGIISTANVLQEGLLLYLSFVSIVLSLRDRRIIEMVETQANSLWMINQELHMEIKKREQLNIELTCSHQENIVSRLGTILGLAKLAEYRDMETGKHLERLQEYSGILTRELRKQEKYINYITEAYIDDIHHSIILHDIGKVGVPDAVLLKPGALNPTEFSLIKLHPIIGAESIREIEREVKKKSFLNLGREIAYSHHEKWDGSGYPEGLKGEDIPLSARICALVDVYDALTSKRPYKEAFSHEKALRIIVEGKGSHFDPDIVDAFLGIHDNFNVIRESLQG